MSLIQLPTGASLSTASIRSGGVLRYATPTFVQARSGSSLMQNPTLAYNSDNTAGNLLVAVVASTASASSLTDSKSNTWTKISGTTIGTTNQVDLWYALNCAAGANTVTVNLGGMASSAFAIAEYSGLRTASALDKNGAAASGASASTALDSGSGGGTTTQSVELWVFGGAAADAGLITFTAGTGYTERADSGSTTFSVELSEKITAAVATLNGTATASASVLWGAVSASFKAATL